MHRSLVLPAPVRVREWQPSFPPGDLRGIALHWTAATYDEVFPAYHFCLRGAADVLVVQTHDVVANMRSLTAADDGRYAAHVAGRNGHLIGIAVCAMGDATPSDFGRSPLTRAQIDALVSVARTVAAAYAIAPAAIRTHAEFACEDGYFGAGEGQRWDIARLAPRPEPLEPGEAAAVGDFLRATIARN